MTQGAQLLTPQFDTGTGKLFIGDGNDYPDLLDLSKADGLVSYKTDPVSGGIKILSSDKNITEAIGGTIIGKESVTSIRPVIKGTAPVLTTYTVEADYNTAMGASPVVVEFNDARILKHGVVFADGPYWKIGADIKVDGNLFSRPQVFEFVTDSLIIGYKFRYAGANLEVWVDDELVQSSVTATPGSVNAYYWLTINLTSAALCAGPHKIKIAHGNQISAKQISVTSGKSVWAPEYERLIKAVILGDSYVEGQNAGGNDVASGLAQARGFAHTLSYLMGWRQAFYMGNSGTGYITTTATGRAYIDRLQQASSYSPDIFITTGGYNDKSLSPTDVRAAADLYWATAKNLMPNAVHICVGAFSPNGATPAAIISAIRDAAINAGVIYIDSAWFSSTSWLHTDFIHPNQAGHDVIAYRLARQIKQEIVKGF